MNFKKMFASVCRPVIAMALLVPLYALGADAGKVVLVNGQVTVSGKAVNVNSSVAEGAVIQTGKDGYIYIKTIDDGFLILRPNSEVRIVNYTIDNANPTNTKVKFELVSGVARSITGDSVKNAKKSFRFNTPVAAIGVRGTDFTVYTDKETTRVSVYSGGVVASGFGQHCLSSGSGPCEGANSLELFARQQGQILQISRDQLTPQLLKGGAIAPDAVSPPKQDEPSTKLSLVNSSALNNNGATVVDITQTKVTTALQSTTVTTPVIIPVAPLKDTIIWGRWREVLGQATEIDMQKQADEKSQVLAINNYYALLRSKNSEGQLPVSGEFGFALQGAQAVIYNEANSVLTPAAIENAKLNINFNTANFKTSFDLLSQNEKFSLQSEGVVLSGGVLNGNNQYSHPTNMAVTGVVTGEKGLAASYLFQSRLDGNRLASGVTFWKGR